jgi:DNA-binding response OmpR family regulator
MSSSGNRHKHRVLVIEDHHDLAESTSTLVEILGHESCVANTGHDALEQASRFEPEIVILDLALPDISGFEVARELRARAAGRPLYITAYTSWMKSWSREAAFAAGCDNYVVKPGNLAALLHAATLQLDASARGQQGRSGPGVTEPSRP